MAADTTLTHEYLMILGLPAFSEAATGMLLGKDSPVVSEGRAFGIQCLSGTGSLRVAGDFLAQVMEKGNLLPFVDCAYQGFASGDLDKDARIVRYFVGRGFELFCAQSFAKNFGLYSERAGNLTIVVKDANVVANIKSQMTILIRGNYSNPPAHGARVVLKVLSSPDLYEEWKGCIRLMANRIIDMRKGLRERLEKLSTPGSWSHITSQIGMFSYTGLTLEQISYLVEEKHIYLVKSGRISMCGVNTGNIDYLAESIKEAVVKFPASN